MVSLANVHGFRARGHSPRPGMTTFLSFRPHASAQTQTDASLCRDSRARPGIHELPTRLPASWRGFTRRPARATRPARLACRAAAPCRKGGGGGAKEPMLSREPLYKLGGWDDRDLSEWVESKQIGVAGDDQIGMTVDRQFEKLVVGGIAALGDPLAMVTSSAPIMSFLNQVRVSALISETK